MALYPNRRAGTCTTCSAKVAAQAGFISRSPSGGWDVFCNSNRCIPTALQTKHANQNRKELTADGELYFPYDVNALDLLRSLPPTRDRSKKVWDDAKRCRNVSLEMEDRPRILEICKTLGIKVADELKTVAQDPSVDAAMARASVIPTLYDFQPTGIEFLARRRRAILGDDMGLGKTFQALLAADPSMGMLVVCPSAVKYSWEVETRKWRPDLTPEVLEGRDSFRWPKAGEVVILNFELLPKWLMPVQVGTLANGKKIMGAKLPNLLEGISPKNVIFVVDECQRAKNYRSQLHKKIKELATLCGRTWFLTGTLLEGRPTDLWGVLQAGHMERDVFGGWGGFVRCFNGTKTGFKGAYQWGSPTPETPERLRRVMLRRLKEEVLSDLPPTVWTDVVVDVQGARFQGQLNKAYDRVLAMLDEGRMPSFESLSGVRAKLAESRIPAMLDMVEDYEAAGTPLVVFSAYKAPINKLGERDGWRIITGEVSAVERQEIVQEFQAGKLKGVGLTIAAGGVGITLTNASNVLFVDMDWVPAKNLQAVDRVRRIGQKASSIQVLRMLSDHPVDRRVHQILARKMEMIHKAIEATTSYEIADAPAGIAIYQESQADFDARMARIQAAAAQVTRNDARLRILNSGWLSGERQKANRPEAPITPTMALKVRDALQFMLASCDGAQARDNVGFNKPDAGRARVLAETGLTQDGELRTAERILSRYHRQLHVSYPELFI